MVYGLIIVNSMNLIRKTKNNYIPLGDLNLLEEYIFINDLALTFPLDEKIQSKGTKISISEYENKLYLRYGLGSDYYTQLIMSPTHYLSLRTNVESGYNSSCCILDTDLSFVEFKVSNITLAANETLLKTIGKEFVGKYRVLMVCPYSNDHFVVSNIRYIEESIENDITNIKVHITFYNRYNGERTVAYGGAYVLLAKKY